MVVCVTRSRKCGAVDCHFEYLSANWKLGVNRPFLRDRTSCQLGIGSIHMWDFSSTWNLIWWCGIKHSWGPGK